MKNIIVLFFIFQVVMLQAQLFPELPKDTGSVEMTVTKNYGRRVSISINKTVIKEFYFARFLSGWKTTRVYDNNKSKMLQTNQFKGKIRVQYLHSDSIVNNQLLFNFKKEIKLFNKKGTHIHLQNEFIYQDDGKLSKVNVWSLAYNKKPKKPLVEIIDIKYKNNQIVSYLRGNTQYLLKYNTENQLVAIEKYTNGYYYEMYYTNSDKISISSRKLYDGENYLIQKWLFSYNELGQIETYRLEYINNHNTGVEINPTTRNFTDYYKYDKKGNWIKQYKKVDGSNRKILHAKRRIKYAN